MSDKEKNESSLPPNKPEGDPEFVFSQLLKNIDEYMPGQNIETITKAYHKAAKCHEHQQP